MAYRRRKKSHKAAVAAQMDQYEIQNRASDPLSYIDRYRSAILIDP